MSKKDWRELQAYRVLGTVEELTRLVEAQNTPNEPEMMEGKERADAESR